MAHSWHDFAGASMALAGPYDLCVRQDGAGVQWWFGTSIGLVRIKQGRAETMAAAKAATEAAYADYIALLPRSPVLSGFHSTALRAADARD
ncbi:hypothetical protein [Methylobacterium radiotolerans]|uniref:hypothetical protein n=1 Tax=Methylobacterium radiotolerans TaxID=31998 RepID=UPI001F16DE60|nr:hypothetical protein [Methylobacterium radiotolerans]UIY45823.1 hypothetical protein LZ599_32470 [Methylobacterium radiotolerans]